MHRKCRILSVQRARQWSAATRFFGIALAVAMLGAGAASAQPFPGPAYDDSPIFSKGPVEYHAGRGLRVGEFLTIGGFATFEAELPEGERGELALDGPNFLIRFEPIRSLRFFGELEMGDVWEHELGAATESDPMVNAERLYAEYEANDALRIRVGKFQIPLDRWNPVPAEPFVWTVTQPAVLEIGIGEESMTGAMVSGSFHGTDRSTDYWVFGQSTNHFDLEDDEDPPDHHIGARVEHGDALGSWSVGASVLGSEKESDRESGRESEWSMLGSADVQLRIGEHFEVLTELMISRGDIPDTDFWGAFVEGALHLDILCEDLSTLYFVTRVEHFHPSFDLDTQIADVGFTWLPVPWLIAKAGYRFTLEEIDDVDRGFLGTVSVVF